MSAGPGPVQTTVTKLPDSRVRVDVQIAAGEVEARLQRKAGQLARQLKLPGFRKGKVPVPLALQRLGREAVLDDAVRDGLPGWYVEAIRDSRLVTVGDPDIDLGALPAQGEALAFSFEIGVLPIAELGDYLGLEVGRRESAVAEEQTDREVEALRDRLARLQTVERAARRGDFVVVDYVGSLPQEDGERAPFAGGEGRDQLVELGAGKLIAGFEEGIVGSQAGEARTVEVVFPADYGNAELAGREASFQIAVKEVKAKELPDVDEDFAIDAGFDDVAELRADIAARLLEGERERVQEEFRDAVLDAVVTGARVEVPSELARARAREMWERMLHSLAHRGITREAYLRIVGSDEEAVLAEMAAEAERGLRREAVLSAIVAAEGIEPSEEDLLKALAPTAEREGLLPAEVLARLRESDRLEELSEDLAARQALELIVERAKPIPLEAAAARERLWTPDKDTDPQREQLWTPTR